MGEVWLVGQDRGRKEEILISPQRIKTVWPIWVTFIKAVILLSKLQPSFWKATPS